MKSAVVIVCTFMTLLLPSAAIALTFTATMRPASGRPLDAEMWGEEVTIDVRMSNPDGDVIHGVGAGVFGWDQSIFRFVSAEMNSGPYFCTNAGCTTGLTNSLAFPADEDTGNFVAGPTDVQNVAGIGNYVPFVQAISTVGRAGNGARDPGLDGIVNGMDAQFRLHFLYYGLGTSTISIGTSANPILGNVVVLAGGVTEQAQTVWLPVPEPGTAILVGLGLAGLATVRRR